MEGRWVWVLTFLVEVLLDGVGQFGDAVDGGADAAQPRRKVARLVRRAPARRNDGAVDGR